MPLALDPRLDITLPPAFEDMHGRAWIYRLGERSKDQAACLRSWIVEAPWAHPLWHSYLIGVVHLRPIDGGAPVNIVVPGATHEVLVIALNPEHQVRDLSSPLYHLQPINFAGQWKADSDDAAIAKVQECVIDICAGRLSPDTDFRSMWRRIFGLPEPTFHGFHPAGHA